LNELKEKEIIQFCKERNPLGQRALVYQYSKVLMGLAYRYTLSKESSKDILQDTFIHVFQKIDLYSAEKGAFLPWLKSVAIRMILMHMRKEKALLENQQKYVAHQERHSSYELIDSNIVAKDLYKMVLRLPDLERLIFNMHAIEGYAHKEIAIAMGITESYSRTILTRARKSLQKLLSEGNFLKKGTYDR
jgi:RNA polymerase sigma factor (sigma-70 family)